MLEGMPKLLANLGVARMDDVASRGLGKFQNLTRTHAVRACAVRACVASFWAALANLGVLA